MINHILRLFFKQSFKLLNNFAFISKSGYNWLSCVYILWSTTTAVVEISNICFRSMSTDLPPKSTKQTFGIQFHLKLVYKFVSRFFTRKLLPKIILIFF